MCGRLSRSTIMVVVAAATAVILMSIDRISAQGQAASAVALQTSWGEPDLQGIWTDEFDTPFQRPAKYANQDSSPTHSGKNWTKSDWHCLTGA